MSSLNRNTYLFYGFIIVFQLILGFFHTVDMLDINIHDTYFVFSGIDFSIFLIIIIGISLFIHFLSNFLKKRINKTILFIQLLFISAALLIINYGIYAIMMNMNDMPRNFYQNNESSLLSNVDLNVWITLALLILLLSPFLGVLNFVVTLLKRSTT
ncbi:hypothetical protein [Tenacibaculum xiamenense]|uniref:hypothetical protein n=1 Tax=Tenacibaculum xiamenense TaxID=1261553 RepID=UPI0038B4827C